jgi:hypothetical protein
MISSFAVPLKLLLTQNFQISLVYIVLTTVLFLFPPELPATGSNMSELDFLFCDVKAQS